MYIARLFSRFKQNIKLEINNRDLSSKGIQGTRERWHLFSFPPTTCFHPSILAYRKQRVWGWALYVEKIGWAGIWLEMRASWIKGAQPFTLSKCWLKMSDFSIIRSARFRLDQPSHLNFPKQNNSVKYLRVNDYLSWTRTSWDGRIWKTTMEEERNFIGLCYLEMEWNETMCLYIVVEDWKRTTKCHCLCLEIALHTDSLLKHLIKIDYLS